MSDATAASRIQKDITDNRVMLFMKGNALFPQCGFSARVVQILSHLGVPFTPAGLTWGCRGAARRARGTAGRVAGHGQRGQVGQGLGRLVQHGRARAADHHHRDH